MISFCRISDIAGGLDAKAMVGEVLKLIHGVTLQMRHNGVPWTW